MDFQTFTSTLEESTPPEVNELLQALWHDAKEDWEAAHEIAQTEKTNHHDWLHAYLHRKEGDQFNAGYWYRRAGKNKPKGSLEEEWEILAKAFIDL